MKIAVVGAGISGLGCAWLLSKRHDVVLFEKNAYLGGHANTVAGPNGQPVDTGFIVYNERTYPHLVEFFRRLGVQTQESAMTFSYSIDDGALEYAGTSLATLFGQRRNLLRPGYYRMLFDIWRFFKLAPAVLEQPATADLTLGQFLDRHQFGEAFRRDHLLPMAAAIWSASEADILDHPITSFVRFFTNHGLLSVTDRPVWRTVTGGSREYVAKLLKDFGGVIISGHAVSKIDRQPGKVTVYGDDGKAWSFDTVVIAAHADTALSLLASPTAAERRLLGAFRYSTNRAVLHQDGSLMPKRRRVWASWNYLSTSGRTRSAAASTTYWMNNLQAIDETIPLFVSINPLIEPAADLFLSEFTYTHPLFDADAVAAQQGLGQLQGDGGIWYCGSYFGYGFHEDGLASAVAVAEGLGSAAPWAVTDSSPARENARMQTQQARSASLGNATGISGPNRPQLS